jgi:hypothetical protein
MQRLEKYRFPQAPEQDHVPVNGSDLTPRHVVLGSIGSGMALRVGFPGTV